MREQQVIRTVGATVAMASIAAAALLSAGSARAGELYVKAASRVSCWAGRSR